MRSRRFVSREGRDLHRETLVSPFPELGLVAADGPRDPEPELVVEDAVVTRMDGRPAAEFDVIDRFVVAHGLDLEVATEAMALDDLELAVLEWVDWYNNRRLHSAIGNISPIDAETHYYLTTESSETPQMAQPSLH